MAHTTDLFDLTSAPLRIATVRLKVRDLDAVSRFYETVLGLRRLETEADGIALGGGAGPLLRLTGDPSLARRNPHHAGLFHTAFLLPTRADLACWLASAVAAGVPLHGASDHSVSEAIYLADPEGNGIEVYADRPMASWRMRAGHVHMSTERLDLRDLLHAAASGAWAGFPDAGRIGHVHLQVGDIREAEEFYAGILGLHVTRRYPGASFFGSGGYHHQVAGNVWNSRDAGPRPSAAAGLDEVEVTVKDAATREAIAARAAAAGLSLAAAGDHLILHDPWGTRLRLHP